MSHHDASTAECLIFTFKEGLLSPIAHDLKIRVTELDVDVDAGAGTATGRFAAGSLRVVCARKDGRDAPHTLSEENKAEIEDNIRTRVLHADRFPEVRYEASSMQRTGDRLHIEGEIELHGTTRPLALTAERRGDRWVAEAELHQPDFGIEPYKAAMGTLRVKPTVRVRISVPAE